MSFVNSNANGCSLIAFAALRQAASFGLDGDFASAGAKADAPPMPAAAADEMVTAAQWIISFKILKNIYNQEYP